MKKVSSILLVAVMLVACLATSAFAATSGEEVTVEFYASNNPGFVNYGAAINYDSSALTLKSISAGALSTAGFFDGYEVTGIVGFFGNDEVIGDGVLFTAVFEVNEGAEAGDYAVTATLDTLSTNNAAGEEVSFGISGATITVEEEVVVTPEPTEEPEPSDEPVVTDEPTATKEPVDPSKSPKTGDFSMFVLVAVIVTVCAAAAIVVVSTKKSKQK